MSEWLNMKAAAKYLGIGRVTLYRWRDKGIIKVYEIAGRSAVKKEDLDRLLAGKSPESAGEAQESMG